MADRELSGPVAVVAADRPRVVLRRLPQGKLSAALGVADAVAAQRQAGRRVRVRPGEGDEVVRVDYERATVVARKA